MDTFYRRTSSDNKREMDEPLSAYVIPVCIYIILTTSTLFL